MGAGTFDEALALIDARVAPLERESVPLAEAAGRTLAAPLLARADAPPVATSAMDGYAVIHAATQPGVPLVVIGESRPGARFAAGVSAGQAVRIFTGAALPAGADCVIMQEYAERSGAQVRGWTHRHRPAPRRRKTPLPHRETGPGSGVRERT